MRLLSWTLATAALLSAALPARPATLTWYTNRAAWEAAVGGVFTLIDFSEVAPGSYSTSAGVVIEDVQFQAYNESGNWYLYVSDNNPSNPNLYASGNSTSYPPVAYTLASFLNGAAYIAAGVDVATSSSYFYIKESATGQWTPVNNSGFVGFVSSAPVSQIWFASRSGAAGSPGYYTLDNFVFSSGVQQQPEETPDLGTLILCGTGLSLLSLVFRSRNRAKT